MRAVEDELILKGFSPVLPHCAVGDCPAKYWLSQCNCMLLQFSLVKQCRRKECKKIQIVKIVKENKCS